MLNQAIYTHTDASLLISGTFNGTMVLNADDSEVAKDVVVTVSHLDTENTQAVTINFKSATLGMDQTGVFNVAKANNELLLASGNPQTSAGQAMRESAGRLNGNTLTFYLKLSSSYKFSAGSSAKIYKIVATKAE